jgi:hypothetical protein
VSIEGVGATSVIRSHFVAGWNQMDEGLIMLSGGTNPGQHISGIYLTGDGLAGDNAIVVTRSNVSIYNTTVIDFAMQGIRFWGSGDCTGNSIHDCSIINSAGINYQDYGTPSQAGDRQSNVAMAYQTGFLFYNNVVNNSSRPDGQNGIGFKPWDQVYGPKVFNNHFIGPEVCNGANYYPFVIEFWNQTHFAGYGTEIYDNAFIGQVDFGSGGAKGSYGYAFYVHDNTFGSNTIHPETEWTCGLQIEEHVQDVIVSSNHFKNLETPIYLCSQEPNQAFSNIRIYNNIFENVVFGYQAVDFGPPTGYSSHGTAIMIGGSVRPVSISSIYVWNNTFVAYAARPAETAIWLPTAYDCHDIYVQNNIIVGFATAPYMASWQASGGTLDNVVIQQNVLHGNGNGDNLLQSNITITNLTDSLGIKSDPLFVSPTDFHLQAGSPAIGTNNPGVDTGIATDFAGNPVNNPRDLGAYKYP